MTPSRSRNVSPAATGATVTADRTTNQKPARTQSPRQSPTDVTTTSDRTTNHKPARTQSPRGSSDDVPATADRAANDKPARTQSPHQSSAVPASATELWKCLENDCSFVASYKEVQHHVLIEHIKTKVNCFLTHVHVHTNILRCTV